MSELQHPAARCGRCEPCKHLEATRHIVLAHSAPAGPGIRQQEADLWNKTLANSPCEMPLVMVCLAATRETVKGRVQGKLPNGEVLVMTAEYGPVALPAGALQPWTPRNMLDGTEHNALMESLSHMPSTWYPSLVETILRAALAKQVYLPGALTALVTRLETEKGHVVQS